jgi:hypothetical protein
VPKSERAQSLRRSTPGPHGDPHLDLAAIHTWTSWRSIPGPRGDPHLDLAAIHTWTPVFWSVPTTRSLAATRSGVSEPDSPPLRQLPQVMPFSANAGSVFITTRVSPISTAQILLRIASPLSVQLYAPALVPDQPTLVITRAWPRWFWMPTVTRLSVNCVPNRTIGSMRNPPRQVAARMSRVRFRFASKGFPPMT